MLDSNDNQAVSRPVIYRPIGTVTEADVTATDQDGALIGTPKVYGLVQETLTAAGETVGAESCFAFIPATDEERKAWEQERLGTREGVYFLPYEASK